MIKKNNNFRELTSGMLGDEFEKIRNTTITIFEHFENSLNKKLHVKEEANLNLPLWEFSHVAWFSEKWIIRNKNKKFNLRKNYFYEFKEDNFFPNNYLDDLFDSAKISHAKRWQIHLPEKNIVKDYLKKTKIQILKIIECEKPSTNDECYFYRLAIAHEIMHIEAFKITAQKLGIELPRVTNHFLLENPLKNNKKIYVKGCQTSLMAPTSGFYFDNEISHESFKVNDFIIDSQPVTINDFFQFINSGEYYNHDLWSIKGKQWLKKFQQNKISLENSLVKKLLELPIKNNLELDDTVLLNWFGKKQKFKFSLPIIHLNFFEAEAYSNFKNARLPTEVEWLIASKNIEFLWGSVWEWTSTKFSKPDGFKSHPYKEYSEPWFDKNYMVIKGASFATPKIFISRYFRNFYEDHRQDIFVGFRTVKDI